MILLVFFLINSILSGIVAFKCAWCAFDPPVRRIPTLCHSLTDRPNDGTTTYTVFFTNILLLVRVLYRSISQSWEGSELCATWKTTTHAVPL